MKRDTFEAEVKTSNAKCIIHGLFDANKYYLSVMKNFPVIKAKVYIDFRPPCLNQLYLENFSDKSNDEGTCSSAMAPGHNAPRENGQFSLKRFPSLNHVVHANLEVFGRPIQFSTSSVPLIVHNNGHKIQTVASSTHETCLTGKIY